MNEERRGDYINIGKELAEIHGKLDCLPKMQKQLDDIDESLRGNCGPGALTRIAILETKIALPLWLTGILAVAMITAIVTKAIGAW